MTIYFLIDWLNFLKIIYPAVVHVHRLNCIHVVLIRRQQSRFVLFNHIHYFNSFCCLYTCFSPPKQSLPTMILFSSSCSTFCFSLLKWEVNCIYHIHEFHCSGPWNLCYIIPTHKLQPYTQKPYYFSRWEYTFLFSLLLVTTKAESFLGYAWV